MRKLTLDFDFLLASSSLNFASLLVSLFLSSSNWWKQALNILQDITSQIKKDDKFKLNNKTKNMTVTVMFNMSCVGKEKTSESWQE